MLSSVGMFVEPARLEVPWRASAESETAGYSIVREA